MKPIGDEAAHWSPWSGFLRVTALLMRLGLVMGLIFYGLHWYLQDSLREAYANRTFTLHFRHGAVPISEWPTLAAALIFGWAGCRLARRVSGHTGFVLLIPVAVSAAVALVVALPLAKISITPWVKEFRILYTMTVTGILIAAAASIWRMDY